MMIFLVILMFIALGSLDMVPLYKRKKWREMALHTIFMLIGLFLALGMVLNIEILNPTGFLESFFRPLSNFLKS
ncbi:MAG: hypothetical protein D5R97_03650 [Candidatus Syntrophonatronum acetioxidans]|uniref:Uncharacterized protein n=1 Tax=Candidatus Syntrophonatronum acetioxidans TaxID=1795816 RepID=A0A424YG15_9FIRM|nr:MAG: hypothetical protein D5R97_03650 [Candidatus Syntrophonatronum acetioxidans]